MRCTVDMAIQALLKLPLSVAYEPSEQEGSPNAQVLAFSVLPPHLLRGRAACTAQMAEVSHAAAGFHVRRARLLNAPVKIAGK